MQHVLCFLQWLFLWSVHIGFESYKWIDTTMFLYFVTVTSEVLECSHVSGLDYFNGFCVILELTASVGIQE